MARSLTLGDIVAVASLICGIVLLILNATVMPNSTLSSAGIILLIWGFMNSVDIGVQLRKKRRSKGHEVSLDQMIFIGKYEIPTITLDKVSAEISDKLNTIGKWEVDSVKRIATFNRLLTDEELNTAENSELAHLTLHVIESNSRQIIDVECRPVLYQKVIKGLISSIMSIDIENAELQCSQLVRQIMVGILDGTELERVSRYPTQLIANVKHRLSLEGKNDIVDCIDSAQKNIIQNDFKGSIGNTRAALEKVVEFFLERKNLEKTNTFENNVVRLAKNGFISKYQQQLVYDCFYRYLSDVVHRRTDVTVKESRLYLNLVLGFIEYVLDSV